MSEYKNLQIDIIDNPRPPILDREISQSLIML